MCVWSGDLIFPATYVYSIMCVHHKHGVLATGTKALQMLTPYILIIILLYCTPHTFAQCIVCKNENIVETVSKSYMKKFH